MKILILDDNGSLAEALVGILECNGHEADCTTTAEEALSRLQDQNYDLVLLDYKIPGNDGVWLMRQHCIPRKTKVLLMTGYMHRDVVNTMFGLGVSGYITKPFDEEELLHNLEFFLPHHDPNPAAA
jgi:DNA-binding response OmpR family regulator